MEAQIVATQLMLELTGARLVPGTDRRRRRRARAAGRSSLRERARRGAARRAGAARALRRDPRPRSASRSCRGPTRLHVRAAALPAPRRHARGRPDRGGRADRRRRQAAGDDPGEPDRAPGRLTPAQRLRRRAEDVLVGRGLHEVVGWSFTDPALLDRLRLPAGDRLRNVVRAREPDVARRSRSCARRSSARCWTSRAYNHARGTADDRDLRVGRRLPRERRRPARPTSTTRWRRC